MARPLRATQEACPSTSQGAPTATRMFLLYSKLFVDAHQRLRASRLAASVTSERNERAHDHLSRSFYKTLTELRKQQDWRRQQQVIDVTPEPTPLAA